MTLENDQKMESGWELSLGQKTFLVSSEFSRVAATNDQIIQLCKSVNKKFNNEHSIEFG